MKDYGTWLAERKGYDGDPYDHDANDLEEEKNLPVGDTILLTSHTAGDSIPVVEGMCMLRGCVETGCTFTTIATTARYCPIDGGELVARQCECGNYLSAIHRFCEQCGREVAYAATA